MITARIAPDVPASRRAISSGARIPGLPCNSMQRLDTKQLDAPSVRPLAVRVREACRLTGIGRSRLYELIRAGDISVFKVGAMTLICVAELERFLARQQAR